MVLFGIATAEMEFVDLIFPVSFCPGVLTAQEFFR